MISYSSWANTQEYNYSDYDPDKDPTDGAQTAGNEDYDTQSDNMYSVNKDTFGSTDPPVSPPPLPEREPPKAETQPKLKDIMNKINVSKFMESKDENKASWGKKGRRRHFDLGTTSGFKWMLYREPIEKQNRKVYELNDTHSVKQVKKYSIPSSYPVISKKSLKKLIKKISVHPPISSKYMGKYRYRKNLNLTGTLQKFPITISINPMFRANNMQSASVIGYGLGDLLKLYRLSPIQYNGNNATIHHIAKRSYRQRYNGQYPRKTYQNRRQRRLSRYRSRRYRKQTTRKTIKRKRTYARRYTSKKYYRKKNSEPATVYHTGNYNGGYSQAYWSYLQNYYPKIYLHYLDGSYSKGNYRTYYNTYLKSSHVKGYNKKGYRLGSYRSGIDDKDLKTPSKPRKPKTFKFKMEEPNLGNQSCPYAWLKYGGSCYFFSRDELNWYKATVSLLFTNFILMFGILVVVHYGY